MKINNVFEMVDLLLHAKLLNMQVMHIGGVYVNKSIVKNMGR